MSFLRIVTSRFFYLLLSLIIMWSSSSEVECLFSFNDKIYVVDCLNDPFDNSFDSWLTHPLCLPNHLDLTQLQIDTAVITGTSIYSPGLQGEFFISECDLKSIQWSILITRHPEMVNPGYSCVTEYTLGAGILGPRNPVLTLEEFLITHCV
jgi:hypothetical protein